MDYPKGGKKPYFNNHHQKGETPPPPLPLASGPDRCFLIDVMHRRSKSFFPETSFTIGSEFKGGPVISTAWQASSKARVDETGFLDLPKEIRDLVYGEVCADLRREGFKWQSTAPPSRLHRDDASIPRAVVPDTRTPGADVSRRPAIFSDCAIIATCHQLHAEFAELLYATPMNITGIYPGWNNIPLPRLYTPLIRTVYVQLCPPNPGSSKPQHNSAFWCVVLQSATSLNRILPNLTTLRLGTVLEPGNLHTIYMRTDENKDISARVQDVERAIRRAMKDTVPGLKVPWNMEVVMLRGLVRRVSGFSWPNYWEEVENVVDEAVGMTVKKMRVKKKVKKVAVKKGKGKQNIT